MPMMQDWDLNLNIDFPYLSEGLELFENLNLSPLGDLWKSELESLSEAWNAQDDAWSLDCKRGSSVIRVHDCMWAGTCGSEEHAGRKLNDRGGGRHEPSDGCRRRNPATPSRATAAAVTAAVSAAPRVQRPPHRPDTPQSEDDKDAPEEELQYCPLSEITNQRRRFDSTSSGGPRHRSGNIDIGPLDSVTNDHNYNTKQPRRDDLGVQTPSDSEEEEETEEYEEEEEEEEEVEEEEEEEECGSSEEEDEEEIDVVSVKPTSPVRRRAAVAAMPSGVQRDGRRWRRESPQVARRVVHQQRTAALRVVPEVSHYDIRLASQAVSKRIGGSVPSSPQQPARRYQRVGAVVSRHKRKRSTSDEEERLPPPSCASRLAQEDVYTPSRRGRPDSRRKYTAPSKKTRISDSETDSTEKRSQHNNMERMRRIDLRNAFDDLRSLVPSLADAARAAKVTILRDAASYCLQLTSHSKTLQSQAAILKREQEKLRSNLSKLRKHMRSHHMANLPNHHR